MRRAGLLALLLLAIAAPPSLGCASAAGVPCGYIYPRLLFDLGERGATYTLTQAEPLRLEGTLTFTWDATAEGMAAPNPTTPIEVSFSFPRKPDWLAVEVSPPRLEVPITPDRFEANQSAGGLQVVYRYTVPIALDARLNGTPVLEPDAQPSLLLLAQSSESGLYKPGFGVRNLALALPEAVVQATVPRPAGPLRVGEAVPVQLPPLEVRFQGATLALKADGPVELWKPARLTATVTGPSGPSRGLDMAASVVDERSSILYTTGLRSRGDGALAFTYTFPAPGHYRVLVAARPLPGVSDLAMEPLVAEFDVLLPGVEFDAVRYPDAYRAEYVEPTSEFHANTNDPPRQYEKLLRFPVLGGADSASVQLQLGSSAANALGAGSLYAEVLGPGDEQLAYGKLDAFNPTMDARLRGPLPIGEHKVHLYGSGANPLALGGTTVHATLGVFYPQAPVAPLEARGAPRPLAGGAIPLGTGTMELELVLHDEPRVWEPLHAMLVAKDAAGRVALHPDFILTAKGPVGNGTEGVLYTTGHRHPHDGLLHWGLAFPQPGLYVVSAFAGPTPEASGAFWQPAIASWPLLVPGGADGVVRYPQHYRADYHDSTSSVALATYAGGAYDFEKRYLVPVKEGATRLGARLDLMTNAFADHVEGVGPASLQVTLLDPQGQSLGTQHVAAAGSAEVTAQPKAPGLYTVWVYGVGYAPLDYAGSMYNLTITADYPAPVEERAAGSGAAPSPERRAAGPELALVLVAMALMAVTRRR